MSYFWTEFKIDTHTVPTNTKSIGTDLSMMDIGCLEDLQKEITELRKEVASLEAKLRGEGKGEFETNLVKKQHQKNRNENEVQESEDVPSLSTVCKKEPSLTASQYHNCQVVDKHGVRLWRTCPPCVFKQEPMEICDSVSGSGDKQTAQMLEVPALFLPCYSDPSSTEAQGRQCGSEDKGKDLNMLPLSLHCYSDPNPAETLNADHSGDPNTPQELKDVPNLPPVFKTEPNPTETLEPDCSTGDQHTLQDDVPSLSLYCYTDIHQAHAQDSDYNGKEELEESVPTLSHCYGDTNPTESLGSDCDGRDQYTLQTPLKMCSVRLVDCRTVVKLNGNITPQEEQNDYFQKNFKSSNVHMQSFSYESPSASEHNIQKGGVCRSTSLDSCHITDSHLNGDTGGESHSCVWRREEFFTQLVPSMHLSERNGNDLRHSSFAEKYFSTSAHLASHCGLHAANDKLYPCNLCGKSFTDLSHRKSHERMHSGEGPYQCAQCGESFSFFYRFQNHQKAHAEGSDAMIKPYQCSHCKKQFATKGSLVVHSRVHTGERPYPCSFCDQTFTRSDRLKDHERVHTGEKPYQCSSCGKQFTQAASLRTHRRIHTGEKPYCCSTCDRRFSDLTGLRTHERRHTGERPYRCSQCGRSFAQASNLVTHFRRHRAENTT